VAPADPAQQMRYRSLCTNEYRKPYVVTECAFDSRVPVDGSGRYTIVTSSAQRRRRGVTIGRTGSRRTPGPRSPVPAQD
jgi:hypothetical protein